MNILSFTLSSCALICILAIVKANTEISEEAEPSVYDFQKYFFKPRTGRNLDVSSSPNEVKHNFEGSFDGASHANATEESEGRLFPGAPSFFARLAFRVLAWKIFRAAAQYFVDLLMAEMFAWSHGGVKVSLEIRVNEILCILKSSCKEPILNLRKILKAILKSCLHKKVCQIVCWVFPLQYLWMKCCAFYNLTRIS